MTNSLNKVEVKLKSGDESLRLNNEDLSFTLLDFWRWSVSDILSNATRGMLAEFIVATAVEINIKVCREEWKAFDLETKDNIKIEVKSAAYLQSWFQKRLSKISFSTRAAAWWDSDTNTFAGEKKRHADVYVFCLLHHTDKHTVDPLNLDQWSFYILSTKQLNAYARSQHSITLQSLQRMTKAVSYEEIRNEVRSVYALL